MMKYTPSHEWITVDGNQATIGITEYAKKELGEIVHVELPKIGHQVRLGKEICVLESTKAAADVYAPASGKIIAVNEALKASSALINESPEKKGWICKLELSEPLRTDWLLSREQYLDLVKG